MTMKTPTGNPIFGSNEVNLTLSPNHKHQNQTSSQEKNIENFQNGDIVVEVNKTIINNDPSLKDLSPVNNSVLNNHSVINNICKSEIVHNTVKDQQHSEIINNNSNSNDEKIIKKKQRKQPTWMNDLLADAEWHSEVTTGAHPRNSGFSIEQKKQERLIKLMVNRIKSKEKKAERESKLTPEERAIKEEKQKALNLKRKEAAARRAKEKEEMKLKRKLLAEERKQRPPSEKKPKKESYYAGSSLAQLLNATEFVTGNEFDENKRREVKPVERFIYQIDESSVRKKSQKGRTLKQKNKTIKIKRKQKDIKTESEEAESSSKGNGLNNTPTPELEQEQEQEPEPTWFTDIKCEQIEIDNDERNFFQDFVYEDKNDTYIPDNTQIKKAADIMRSTMKLYKIDHEAYKLQRIELHFPLSDYKEEYLLALPKDDAQFNPFEEIGKLMELMALAYFPDEFKQTVINLENPENCIIGKFINSFDNNDIDSLIKCITDFNDIIDELRNNGKILNHLKNTKHFPESLINEILNECYSRRVLPESRKLRHYKAFSNEVYGELMPNFLHQVYKDCNLNHKSTFIDLGSGVGNCVIQAALEFGSKSYGVEIVENASRLADLQLDEFNSRCKIFGLNPGLVKLFGNQSFANNPPVKEVVDQCDVILVNNYLFDTQLNEKVVDLFQDLKVGCKIISLKPIVPAGYTLYGGNLNSILSRLKTSKFIYGENSVSWTSKGGFYYVTEVMEAIIEDHFVRFKSRHARRQDEGLDESRRSTTPLNAFTNNV